MTSSARASERYNQERGRSSPPMPCPSQNRGGIRHRATGPPPLSCLSAPSPLSSKSNRFVHKISSGWRSLAQQVQMGSLIKMNHLARENNPDATAERASGSVSPPRPGRRGEKNQEEPRKYRGPPRLAPPAHLPAKVWLVGFPKAPLPALRQG